MNYTKITTTRTVERGPNFDRFDYHYELEFNGHDMTLRTRWAKNGKLGGGSFSAIDDKQLISDLFHGMDLECFQYDGTPTFNHNGERFHLISPTSVNMGEDNKEV